MRLPGRRRWQLRDEDGVSLIEVMVACVVLSVGVLSVVGAMGSGMSLVGHSRQRTAGAGVAQERLERARNIAYEDLALNEDPAHSTVTGHPDNNVIENAVEPPDATVFDDEYRLSDGACATPPCEEPLIIDKANGGLRHLDDPFTLAQTEFTVHQFVTWVDDPDSGVTGPHDYKRVTVVVTWKFPVHSGPKNAVVESTFVTDGTIDLPTPSPTTAPTASSPPPDAGGEIGVGAMVGPLDGPLSTPSNGTGPCTGDTTPPVLSPMPQLLSGSEGYLNSTSVQVRVKAHDLECFPLTLYMANKPSRANCTEAAGYVEVQQLDGGTVGGDPPAAIASWTIPSGDGVKAVCVAVRNKRNDVTLARSDAWGINVKLDQTPPMTPANFRQHACEISGTDRIATFAWDAATDTNFNGYRLYRSLEAAQYVAIAQTTGTTLTDTSPKNYASVRYVVRAYDKAGNESADSAVISYSKNQC